MRQGALARKLTRARGRRESCGISCMHRCACLRRSLTSVGCRFLKWTSICGVHRRLDHLQGKISVSQNYGKAVGGPTRHFDLPQLLLHDVPRHVEPVTDFLLTDSRCAPSSGDLAGNLSKGECLVTVSSSFYVRHTHITRMISTDKVHRGIIERRHVIERCFQVKQIAKSAF